MKNWIGNSKSIHSPLGASNHSDCERVEQDFYATSPLAIDALLKYETFSKNIWENACGNGHLSKRLIEFGYNVFSSDIIKRDFECEIIDFLKVNRPNSEERDIITNSPYRWAQEYVEKSIETIKEGYKVAMFLKLTFLEGQKRKKMFEKYPPKKVYVFSKRIAVARNGDEEMFKKSSAACYCWMIWEKNFKGKPLIEWI